MQDFEYAAPTTVMGVYNLLSENWGETEIYAGGTDLVTCLKQGLTAPKRVVSLRNVTALRGITEESNAIHIGAATPLAQLLENAALAKYATAVVQAIEGINSQQMINVGTIGGDLCQRPRCWFYRNGYGLFGIEDGKSLIEDGDNRYHAIFGNDGPAKFVSASSTGPALIALGASLIVSGPEGERTIAAWDFFQTPESESDRETALKANEVLTKIIILKHSTQSGTYEIRHRAGLDWPYVTASVAINEKASKVVLGHVAPTPWVSDAAGKALNGRVKKADAEKAGEAAAEGATPLSQNAYKVAMVKTAVKRAVLRATGQEEEA